MLCALQVPELSELRVATDSTQRQELRVGAAVTLQSAIDYLHATSTGETGRCWFCFPCLPSFVFSLQAQGVHTALV